MTPVIYYSHIISIQNDEIYVYFNVHNNVVKIIRLVDYRLISHWQ